VDIIIIAAFIIGVIVLIGIAALWMKRRKADEDKVPLFNCSITSEGKESGVPDSADVYDCVEADEDSKTSDKT
jgi:hypothetical protein